ncbi:hypothetical protein [Jatrophihabitans fulvus]
MATKPEDPSGPHGRARRLPGRRGSASDPRVAVAALAGFLRDRLAVASDRATAVAGEIVGQLAGQVTADAIVPLLRQLTGNTEVVTSVRGGPPGLAAARQVAVVVAGAAAPFAPNAYARARLLRQLHATGLLTADDAYRIDSAAGLVLDSPFPSAAVVDVRVEPAESPAPGPDDRTRRGRRRRSA